MIARLFIIAISCILIFPALSNAFCYEEAAGMYNLSIAVLRSVSITESPDDPVAINWNSNGTYDFGVMQINSVHYKTLGPERWDALADPCYNVKVGASILSQCIDQHGYTWKAIGCYNAGSKPSREGLRKDYAWKVYENLKKLQKTIHPALEHNSSHSTKAAACPQCKVAGRQEVLHATASAIASQRAIPR